METGKGKGLLAVLMGGAPNKGAPSTEEDDFGPEMKREAAQKMLDAFKRDDADGLMMALDEYLGAAPQEPDEDDMDEEEGYPLKGMEDEEEG